MKQLTIEYFTAYIDVYQSIKNNIVEKLTENFKSLFTSIFKKYPNLESFAWTQYTPSFCDGDPCPFYVNIDEDEIFINELGSFNEPENEDELEEFIAPNKEISAILRVIPSDIYNKMFGEGVKITVTREEVKVDHFWAYD